MESTIRQLFEGRLPVFEQLAPIGKAQIELRESLCEKEKYILGAMPAETQEQFNEYLDIRGKLIEMSNEDAFTYGFKLAARILVECFEPDADEKE
jgi:hypothetical protein